MTDTDLNRLHGLRDLAIDARDYAAVEVLNAQIEAANAAYMAGVKADTQPRRRSKVAGTDGDDHKQSNNAIDYQEGKFYMTTKQELEPDVLVRWCNNMIIEYELARNTIFALEDRVREFQVRS